MTDQSDIVDIVASNAETSRRHIVTLMKSADTTSSQVIDEPGTVETLASDAMSKLRVSKASEIEDSRRGAGRIILCPVCDDEWSANAVEWAVENIFRDERDTIHLLQILPARDGALEYAYVTTPTTRADVAKLEDETREKKRIDRVQAKHFIQSRFGRELARQKVPYVIDLTTGAQRNAAIGDLICAVAAAIHANCIVMSTHNRSVFTQFFVGSVANYCLRNATVPVVMIRPGERAQSAYRRRVLIEKHGDKSADASA